MVVNEINPTTSLDSNSGTSQHEISDNIANASGTQLIVPDNMSNSSEIQLETTENVQIDSRDNENV